MIDDQPALFMRDILFWLADDERLEQTTLYKKLARKSGVGSVLTAMEKRGLVESRYA